MLLDIEMPTCERFFISVNIDYVRKTATHFLKIPIHIYVWLVRKKSVLVQ